MKGIPTSTMDVEIIYLMHNSVGRPFQHQQSMQMLGIPPQGQVHGTLHADDTANVIQTTAIFPGLPEKACTPDHPSVSLIIEIDHVVGNPIRVHDASKLSVAVECGLLW